MPPPRILIFCLTAKGDGTATGEIKENIFAEWPAANYFQVFIRSSDTLGCIGADGEARFFTPSGLDDLRNAITDFNPEVILYRPVPDAPVLHRFAMETIEARPATPLVTWVMDDWPARLEAEDPGQFSTLHADWLWLIDRSARRLSIGDRMSAKFKTRYGHDFEAFANGVDASDWPGRTRDVAGGFIIRYAGALADNMTARSIQRVAEAVENLADGGAKIRLEIKTKAIWKNAQARNFRALRHTSFITDDFLAEEYRAWLSGADAVLIGYNFDADSLRYIGLSIANKLPECLASGATLIAHGPAEAATIAYLKETDCALVIDSPDAEAVREGIEKLLLDADLRVTLAQRARTVAFSNHDIHTIRRRFTAVISEAAGMAITEATKAGASMGNDLAVIDHSRDEMIAVDETEVVACLLSDRTGRSRVMVDVGAHFGTSAAYFNELGWTIHCFEPDPSNRKKLEKRFGRRDGLTIDPRAVGERSAKDVPFYRSDESTGISGLHAFRQTHREDGRADVTTMAEIIEEYSLKRVDFLKIDVEGFDFAVLKGVPWDSIRPDVIECEFEDKKTIPLGHTWKEVAEYLRDKGYAVYLSEWHPIIRYGMKHDWRRLNAFPGAEPPPDGWGNILAFREDPGLETLAEAFDKLISRKNTRRAAHNGIARQHSTGIRRQMTANNIGSRYENFVQWAMSHNPVIHRTGQFAMWCLRTARRLKFATLAFAVLLATLAVCGFLLPTPLSILAWIIDMLAVMAAAGIAIIGFTGHMTQRATDEARHRLASQERQLHRLEKKQRELENQIRHCTLNAARYQRFNRTLEASHISVFIADWAKPLGLVLDEKRLAYLAHRACVLENRMKGRLATSVEAILLRSIVASAVKRDETSILEIGTLFGIGAAAVYEAATDESGAVHLTAIDPLDGYYAAGDRDLLTGAVVSETTLRQNWSLAPIPEEDFTIIKHLSSDPEAIAAAAQRQYDVLIIDGDHSYEGVKFDFDTYAGMVRPGGYILFDDYDTADWPHIKRYVDTEIEGLPHLERIGAAFRTAVYQVRQEENPNGPAA